ncbi:hypothetical protein MGYG_03091 [Nannizzia gypsea CBS 118893]|uniref:Peptidase M20 dimerisation domain-containing protein n=1 Tax=Arthroderma gypseum (strain ATCC MYA-4604 / CBS 118893) TaxID=535722 RepID=E4UQR6_ARTGP|nr:hypothetical protein MGYG_03091 [Nannizzia gypsea CBS 118893]EFR00084.1 hypothetical protein MGYG_03091 [Nannizzia gypsea CBS 118893]
MQPKFASSGYRKIIQDFFPDLEKHTAIYKDLHENPELPCQEQRTAAVVADRLETLGFEVKRNIGGHGVVGILRNGQGQNVLLRAELDALPLKENTGLPYASKVEQVDADGIRKSAMHACAHDMHMACLLGVAALLLEAKRSWSGTVITLFQPNEERLLGAKSMIDDGLFSKIPLPDVCLAQHCVPTKSGTIAVKPGRVLGYLDSLNVRVYGRGAHGATPQLGIDPIILAASILTRLQTIVSREIDPKEPVVIGCGTFHAGTDASTIPEYADFQVDVRTFSESTQKAAKSAVECIIRHECAVSGSPKAPHIVTTTSSPAIDNDEVATRQFTQVLESYYGSDSSKVIQVMPPDIVADDFVILSLPPGGRPPETWEKANREGRLWDLPPTHSAVYAPAIEPTLRTGIEALALSALTFLEII